MKYTNIEYNYSLDLYYKLLDIRYSQYILYAKYWTGA